MALGGGGEGGGGSSKALFLYHLRQTEEESVFSVGLCKLHQILARESYVIKDGAY